MFKGDEIFDWILKRKRCPFCVSPFPVLKCVGFESWQCPKCETEFSLDDEGDLEPVFNENFYRNNDGITNHFPKPCPSSSSSFSNSASNILCSNCTENQQKIVQLLHSFDSQDSSRLDGQHRKQYELYAKKLESRYPLCATCSFRVSAQLKRCEERAGLEERRKTALNKVFDGGDWHSKLKLAEKMKWTQVRRKIVKSLLFWPDFVFQLFLSLKCILKSYENVENLREFEVFNLKIWCIPTELKVSSFFFLICFSLFLIQFHGIALNRRSPFELVPQIFLLISRSFIGNFLYRFESEEFLNLNLTLTAIGLAIIFKVGSRNGRVKMERRREKIIYDNVYDNNVGNIKGTFNQHTNTSNQHTNTSNQQNNIFAFAKDKNGFASYSENHHRFHSFANQVPDDTPKPIMPWPDKPLPGKLKTGPGFNFNENLLLNNGANTSFTMKPGKLSVDDPLELEPMFSSLGLNDEPKQQRRSVSSRSSVRSTSDRSDRSVLDRSSLVKPVINQHTFPTSKTFFLSAGIIYNSLLTTILLFCRISLLNNQTSLITVILALTFGLRGFLWQRLPLKYQLTILTVAVGRLLWLAAELNGKIETGHLVSFAMGLDLILIILR